MEVVLPEIMATLQAASADVKMKALFVIQNIMGHVKRKEASSIAVQHAEELLPLFVDVSEAAVGGRALAGALCSASASGPAVWAALALAPGPPPPSLLLGLLPGRETAVGPRRALCPASAPRSWLPALHASSAACARPARPGPHARCRKVEACRRCVPWRRCEGGPASSC